MRRTSLAPIAAALLLSGSAAARQIELKGRPLLQVARNLKPGQYIWESARAPTGPALVVVNLHTQRLLFFRNGVPIAASTVSSGKTGHETPTGVFTILQKNEKHFSKTYNNAPMPNMQRLTWKGIALHAGNLPGYPASHGCVRLPLAFSKLLFGQTALGMTVIITSHPDFPHNANAPDLEVVSTRAPTSIANAKYEWHPDRGTGPNDEGTVSVVVSKADHEAIVMKGDVKIGSAPVYVHGNVIGAEAYVLEFVGQDGPALDQAPLLRKRERHAHEAERIRAFRRTDRISPRTSHRAQAGQHRRRHTRDPEIRLTRNQRDRFRRLSDWRTPRAGTSATGEIRSGRLLYS